MNYELWQNIRFATPCQCAFSSPALGWTRKGGSTMDYYNAEHYMDRTAAEAMRNVMEEGRAPLNEEGCLRLAEALVKLAAEDYLRAWRCLPCRSARKRIGEIEEFFLSEHFTGLTGLDGRAILNIVRREAKKQ